MIKKQYQYYFLIFSVLVSLVLVGLIIWPFFGPLVLAAVVAFIFNPINKKLLSFFRGQKSVAALLTTAVVIVLIILPLAVLGTQIFKEASQMYQSLLGDGKSMSYDSIQKLLQQMRSVLPIPEGFEFDFSQYVRQILELFTKNLLVIFSSFAKIFFDALVFVIALFFLLRDGKKLKEYFIRLSPMDDKNDEFFLLRVGSSISGVVKGNLMIGIIQGALTGIGFTIFGVPNAALWGMVAAVAALIPGVGTSLVIVPAVVFLFITGNPFPGLGLLVWGATAVGLIDNFLGPKLIGDRMKIHPLAVFISVLGGLAFFGPLGFLIGPLAVSVSLALIDIYFSLQAQAVAK